MRADLLLVELGLAGSRSQAQRLITAGVRWFDGTSWKFVTKSGETLPKDARVELSDDAERRYASRGGLKLQGALDASGVDVHGLNCLDLGQSTGGFTDCLLRRGARHVTGVDVGHSQLADRLRGDVRVTCIERVNARDGAGLAAALLSHGRSDALDLVVGDLSFISLTLVLPAVVPLLRPGARVLMLVKPQFELQPGQLGKGGIVRDEALYDLVRARISACCTELKLIIRGWYESPVLGGDGNREFFFLATVPDR